MPTTTSNSERKVIAFTRRAPSGHHVSTEPANPVRSRFAVTHGGKYLGFADDMRIRLYEDANRAHLFVHQDSAVEIAKTLPILGGHWEDPSSYDVVQLFVPDPVRCSKQSVCQ